MTRSRLLWSGDIALNGGSTLLQDITLTSSSNCKLGINALIPQNAELSFLSFVVPSRIPLYLVAGRGLEVWTENKATEAWFRNVFLNSPSQNGDEVGGSAAWWNTHRLQSDIGILLHVEGRSSRAHRNSEATMGPNITEVLLYGAIPEAPKAKRFPTSPAIPSPTPASTVNGGAATTAVVKHLRVHALLLSSEMVYSEAQAIAAGLRTEDLTAPKAAFGESGVVDAQFLPPPFQCKKNEDQPLPKRRRDETLFGDTIERFRKTQRSDGKETPQTITDSGLLPSRTSQSVITKADTLNAGPEFLVNTRQNPTNFGGSSREGSISTRPQSSDNRSSRLGSPHLPNYVISKQGKVDEVRSARRRNTFSDTRRTLLSLSSNTSTGDGKHQPGILEPPELPEAHKTIEIRNKEMLSRIVMAGMRIYGLQQQKKSNKLRGASEDRVAASNQPSLDTDEYKLVYHQTFKGACFAFRRHIATLALKQDYMRDVVDKLLAVYCNDPLMVSRSEGDSVTSFGQEGSGDTLFAPNSSQRHCKTTTAGDGGVISTPRVRRRLANCAGEEPPPGPASNIDSESPLARRNAASSIKMGILPHAQESHKRQTI